MKNSGKRPARGKQKIDVLVTDKEDTLLTFLLARLPNKSRNIVKAVLKDKQVFVEEKPVSQFDHPLRPGQKVEVRWDPAAAHKPGQELKIIHEDEDLIVIDKPSGLLTVATDKEKRKTAYAMLSDYVKAQDPQNKIFIIHRLDRETSGLLLFAKNEKIKHQIQETWETTIAERTYIAVVEGLVEPPEGTVTSWLKESAALIVYSHQSSQLGKKAITHYKKLRDNGMLSLLKLNLDTGRKHQIRVHMQDIKHPIIGDDKYGSSQNPLRRMGLHAQVLAFTHPKTGKLCRFETAIPGKFLKLFSVSKPGKAR
ncbi:MAG: RluA family pseudouridine synthase [Proteobacteria bacterium]|nr:RluA family pseudouridine synthase [Pseudomonadota bacterium]